MMIQILGDNLSEAMRVFNIEAELKYKTPTTGRYERGPKFEVWELTKEAFETLNAIEEDDWTDEHGWWRHGESTSKGIDTKYIVNKSEMLGYSSSFHEELSTDPNADEEDENRPESYIHLLEYLDINQGVSAERNVTAMAIALAKANDLTLGEFMEKYYA